MPRLLCIALVCYRAACSATRRSTQSTRCIDGVAVDVIDASRMASPTASTRGICCVARRRLHLQRSRDEQMLRVGQEQPLTDRDNVQFQTLSSGVKVQQLRPGDGASVGRSSTIAVEATGSDY